MNHTTTTPSCSCLARDFARRAFVASSSHLSQLKTLSATDSQPSCTVQQAYTTWSRHSKNSTATKLCKLLLAISDLSVFLSLAVRQQVSESCSGSSHAELSVQTRVDGTNHDYAVGKRRLKRKLNHYRDITWNVITAIIHSNYLHEICFRMESLLAVFPMTAEITLCTLTSYNYTLKS